METRLYENENFMKMKTSVLVFAMIIYGEKLGVAMCVNIANHYTATAHLTHLSSLSTLIILNIGSRPFRPVPVMIPEKAKINAYGSSQISRQ